MSSRGKRKIDFFDPNASDPEDLDYDGVERPSPPRRRNRPTSSTAGRRSAKRQRRAYNGSDVDDDDDEIESEDSFTDRSSSEEVEINPSTGRSVRRATKKQIKYEESDEDEIQDTPSEDEDPSPQRRKKAQESIEKPSRIVVLKMPSTWRRSLRTRQGSKSIARGKTPEVAGTRRSNRLSHDVEEPIVELSESGKHVNIVRAGTRSPEPVIARQTRGGKGPKAPDHSVIMEASQEESYRRDDSAGPLDKLLADDNEAQVEASNAGSPEQEAQNTKADDEDEDEEMGGVVQESQPDPAVDEDSEEDGPVTRGGRSRRTRAQSSKRKRGADESSDFEPAPEEEKEEDEMSDSDDGKAHRSPSEESESGSGRRSTRNRTKTRQRSRRQSDSSGHGSMLDADELAEEAQELQSSKRRRLNRRVPDNDLSYDTAPKLRERRRTNVDYRLVRPEQNAIFDDEAAAASVAEKPRNKSARSGYRSLFSNQGPFGGGLEAGLTGGVDSDSSDDEVQKMPKPLGGMVGMTPTTATAPGGFGFPQTHNADAQQSGGGPANLGKVKDKKALADADPLGVDTNVNFDGVGGLDDHINKLKEMVMLPLLYPEAFLQFKITPPRGVLFHGPPGTGKTLLARALASSVSSHGQKVTFYMRKGADALSKWVGEAERQLRLLFEEARKNQPSIIFFDEIDGLAPVRSSKQEQIHASIVATLLALMDGMDGRGQVVVIGATNRPDSVDPALRRPGRFDREFFFPLPDVAGRRAIIDIHTKNWEPPLKPEMKSQLAELTKGYGGADLRALCTEAALNAIQGTYPQIYTSERKLLVDVAKIKVLAKDFMISVNRMVPSSQRTVTASAAPLSKNIEPLLRAPLNEILARIDELIPRRKKLTALEEAEYDDRDDEKGFEREMTIRNFESSRVFRPRLLIHGLQGMGQQYLGAALLNKVEGLHVQSFDLPTILEDASRTPEAAITQLFTEVRRHKPSVIYIPHVDVWYNTLPATAIKTFKLLLRSIGANEPILVLGVLELANEKEQPDPQMMMDLFSFSKNNKFELKRPDQESRREFFNNITHYIRMSPAEFPDPDNRKKRVLPQLEPAPIVEPVIDPAELAAREKRQKKQDRLTLNKLKIVIQPVMDQLKRGYRKFFKPILEDHWWSYLLEEQDPQHITSDLPPEQQQELSETRPWALGKDARGVDMLVHVPSGNKYYNLDLNTIEQRLSNGYYKRTQDFLFDVKTLAKDAKTFGDGDRTLKANEMLANVEVDMEMIYQANLALMQECDAVYARELERERKAKEKRSKELAAGKEPAGEVAPVPPPPAPQQSVGTTETSGPIILGEPVPGRPAMPPITPLRPAGPGSLTNGTSGENIHASQTNGSAVPSRIDEDAHMTDSQDLNGNTQHDFQTPSRFGTQTQKSQATVRTFMAPNSNPLEYHNSASTTNTSGRKTTDRSSGSKLTQSTNSGTPAGGLNFSEMIPQASGTELPDTQEVNYISSQPSNSQPSQASSQLHPMAAPAPPRHTTNLGSILNDDTTAPQLIVDEKQIQDFHESIVTQTSGFSLEQLEQINAALMDAIWTQRAEWNRIVVLHKVKDAFNEISADIQAMQAILKFSQDEEMQEMQDLQDEQRWGESSAQPTLYKPFASQVGGSGRQPSGVRAPYEGSQYI